MSAPTSADGDAVGVLDRMTAIFEAFDENDRGLRVSELAARARLPKSTVSRLVSTLVRQGYLERSGPVIHLGLRLFELGQLAEEPLELRRSALPLVADLRDSTGETVTLAIPDGREMVCVAMMRGATSPWLTRVGGRVPAHATALGKTMLAFSDVIDVEGILLSGLPRLAPGTIVDATDLTRQLAHIREQGVATEIREFLEDVSSVASPVFAESGALLAALSVSGRAVDFDVDRSAPAVRTAALALTRRLASAE